MTFTKEQLIASAHSRIEFAEMMLADNPEPLKERTWSIELELARMALSALESRADAEPVSGTQFRAVADLYSIAVPGGRSVTYSTDAAEASDCRVMGWAVQEYVKLERLQDAYLRPQPAPVVPEVVPDEVIVLLNHLEDVLPDDAFNLIDVKTWNNVSMLSRPDVYRAAMLQGGK